jgi:cytochrome c556
MNKKVFFTSLAVALGAGYALTAFSQAKPEVLVKQRQAVMTLQGKYIGPLVGMLKGAPYDANVVARNAAYLDTLGQMPWDGFVESTKGEKNTRALPVIYSDPGKFKQAQDQLRTSVGALVAASKGGDEGAVKAAIGNVGKACGNCHDNFREKQ